MLSVRLLQSELWFITQLISDGHRAVTVDTENGPELRPKSLLYESLRDTFNMFREENPDVEIGISKFSDLRPPEVVFDDGKANLKICLCVWCHNPARILQSSVLCRDDFRSLVPECPENKPLIPSMFVEKILCEEGVRTRDCHMRQCPACKNKTGQLETDIQNRCAELDIEVVEFELWESTDRVTVVEKVESAKEFSEDFAKRIDKLASHRYEYKNQNRFYNDLKTSLPLNWAIAAGDFSENFQFFEVCEIIFLNFYKHFEEFSKAAFVFFLSQLNKISFFVFRLMKYKVTTSADGAAQFSQLLFTSIKMKPSSNSRLFSSATQLSMAAPRSTHSSLF